MKRILILLILLSTVASAQLERAGRRVLGRGGLSRAGSSLLPFTDSMSTGTINARWAGGSWTAVGDSTIISPSLNNGGFETAGAGGADPFGTWIELPDGSSVIRDTSASHSGGHACAFYVDGSGTRTRIITSTNVSSGVLSYYAKVNNSSGPVVLYNGYAVTEWKDTLTTEWKLFSHAYNLSGTTVEIRNVVAGSAGKVILIDDVTLTRDGYMYSTPTLGAELSSDSTVVGSYYSITATQADYFYTGCAIGYTFRAAARKALDANNKVKRITFGSTLATVQGGVSDVSVSVGVVGTAGTVYGILMNYADTANCVIAYGDGLGNMKLDKCVAGTWTTVITGAVTYAAGGTLKATKTGNNYSIWYRGTQVGSTTAITDASIVSNTAHGLFNTYNTGGNKFDNFSLLRFP